MVALERQPLRQASPPPPAGPDGIPVGARRRTVTGRQAFVACALGAALLSLFASRDLPGWADRLRDGPLTPLLRQVAIGWNDRLAGLDLTLPHEALRETVQRLQDLEWPQVAARRSRKMAGGIGRAAVSPLHDIKTPIAGRQ